MVRIIIERKTEVFRQLSLLCTWITEGGSFAILIILKRSIIRRNIINYRIDMGGAASLIPEQIDLESFRALAGDNFSQEVFDGLKDEHGCISQSLLLDLNSINSQLPRFKEAVTFYQKHNMQPIKVAEVQNLLKEIGLAHTLEGLSTQPKDGKLSFADFSKIVTEILNSINKEVSTGGDGDPNFFINLSDQQFETWVTRSDERFIRFASCFNEGHGLLGTLHTRIQKAVAKNISSKGFSLGQLLDFVNEKCFLTNTINPSWTTAEVVFNVIIPETAGKACCYSDILPGGPKVPETLMSHWWGNTFLELVKSICQHATGKTELYSSMYTDEEKAKTFWLCIFGVNQHVSICKWGFNRSCKCATIEPYKPYDARFEMDKFSLIMESISQHGLALDSQLVTLKRVWVLSELDYAMSHGLDTKFCGEVSAQVLQAPVVPSVQDAEASYPEDKVRIVNAIQERKNGIAAFDRNMQYRTLKRIAVIRIFGYIRMGKVEEVRADINRWIVEWPEIIESLDSHGRRENFLMLAARYGNVELVEFLLDISKDFVNHVTEIGWSALHYAAICFNLDTQVEVVRKLIQAGVNPNLKNNFNRTALEECYFNSGPGSEAFQELVTVTKGAEQILRPPGLLCAAGHTMTKSAYAGGGYQDGWACVRCGQGDENEERWLCMLCESDVCFDCCPRNDDESAFHPEPYDAQLFSHWCLRQDSWRDPGIDTRVGQPLDQTIKIYNNWVKPVEFGTAHEEIVPYQYCNEIVIAAQRVAAYIRYRWPLWDFDKIIFAYATQDNPAFYKVHLTNGTLMQVNREEQEWVWSPGLKVHTLTTIPSSVRFCYP